MKDGYNLGDDINCLNEREAAAALSLTPRTLQAWRAAGTGPTYVRISSRCVRYRVADLRAFAAALVQPSATHKANAGART